MAGLNPETHTKRTYVSISNGKFVQRVTQDNPNAVKRTIESKKDGSKKDVWELIYQDIDANIESIEIDETGDYGDQLKLNMCYADQKFTVTMGMASREAKAFLCSLPNINLNHMVILKPYNFVAKDTGKQIIGLNVYQGGTDKENKVAYYFSKDTPNGLPQVEENADKDEFKLTMKAQEIFLKKYTKKFVENKFKSKVESFVDVPENQESNDDHNSDDLPF